MTTTIVTLGVIWFIGILFSVCAISLPFLWARQFWLPLLMAVAAFLISVMGLSGRTPLGRLPEIGWSWSNDSFQISMRLGSAFILPLVLATTALAIIFLRKKKRFLALNSTP